MRTLGISAALGHGLTVHTATFVAAVEDGFACLPVDVQKGIKLAWACDGMSFAGGQAAAQDLVLQNVDLVVGHFSSQAAMAAIPYYITGRIPVILPCSSQDDLTALNKTGDPVIYRLSCSNTGLLKAVRRLLNAEEISPSDLCVWSADSDYGRQLAAAASHEFGRADAGTYLLLGHHHHIVEKIIQLRQSGFSGRIIILDDAVSPLLADQVGTLFCADILGLVAEVDGISQDSPLSAAPFYRETHLAIQIAGRALAAGGQHAELASILYDRQWQTSAGRAAFDDRGENTAFQFGVWGLQDDAFQRLSRL